jgi:hypothetical protein
LRRLTLAQIAEIFIAGRRERRRDVREPQTEDELREQVIAMGLALNFTLQDCEKNADAAVAHWGKQREKPM